MVNRPSTYDIVEYLDAYMRLYQRLSTQISQQSSLVINLSKFPLIKYKIPWLNDEPLRVVSLNQGFLFWDDSIFPKGHWYFTGGPAIKIDEVHTHTPLSVRTLFSTNSTTQKPEGIVRAILKSSVPKEIWRGHLDLTSVGHEFKIGSGKRLTIYHYPNSLSEFLRAATFGFFGHIEQTPFVPKKYELTAFQMITNLGFFPADLNNKRFFSSLGVVLDPTPLLTNARDFEIPLKHALYRDLTRLNSCQAFTAEDYIRQFSSKSFWDPSDSDDSDELYKLILNLSFD